MLEDKKKQKKQDMERKKQELLMRLIHTEKS